MSLYIATALVDTFSIRANGRTTMSVTAPHLRSFSISRSNYNTLGLGLTQGEPLPTKKYGGSRNGKLERMEQSGGSELKIGSGGERSRCIASQRAHASRRMQAEGAVNRLFDSAPFCMDGDSPRNLDRKNSGYQQDYPQAGPSREGIRPTQRDHGGARSTSSIINDRRGMESIINDRRGMESRSSPLRNLPERAPGVGPAGSYCTVIKVSGLPDTITKEELKEAYAKFGDVRSVRLSLDRKGRFNNSAHVAFYTVDDAQDAADSQDPIILHGSSLRWHLDFHFVKGESLEPTPMLFMLNVPPDTPENVIRAKFRDVTEVWDVIYNDQGKNYVHINLPSAEDAQKIMDRHQQRPYSFGSGSLKIAYTNPSSTIGRTISQYRHVSKSGDDASYKSFKRRGPPSATIFVAGFPAGTSQAHIRQLFERFAEVKGIRIGYHQDGCPRLFCYIDFASEQITKSIMDAHQVAPLICGGSVLRIDYGHPAESYTAPPHHTLRVAGFSGSADLLGSYFSDYAKHLRDVHVSPTNQVGGRGWAVGFVEFDTVENAIRAKEDLSSREVDHGVRLNIKFAPRQIQAVDKGGFFGKDHGGDEFGFGVTAKERSPPRREPISTWYVQKHAEEKEKKGQRLEREQNKSLTRRLVALNARRRDSTPGPNLRPGYS